MLIMFSFLFPFPLTLAQETSWQTAYREYLKEYLDQNRLDQMILVDLNRDGIPELFGGNSSMISSPVEVAITFQDDKVVDLNHDGNGISGWESTIDFMIGLPTFVGLELYQDISRNEYIFFGADSVNGGDSQDGCTYEISLVEHTVFTKEIYCASVPKWEYEEGITETFTFLGLEVTEVEFERKRSDYYSTLQEVDLKLISTGYGSVSNLLDGAEIDAAINHFLNSYSNSFGEDLYLSMASEDKLRLNEFINHFIQNFSEFDITRYGDTDFLDLALWNTFINISPVEFNEDLIKYRPLYLKEEAEYYGFTEEEVVNWPFYLMSANAVDEYLTELFGVVPEKKQKYKSVGFNTFYFEDGYYFFPELMFGGEWTAVSPQVEHLYSIEDGLYYLEYSIYDFAYSDDIDFSIELKENWSQEKKHSAYKVNSGYAIIRDVVIDGVETWNIVKYESNDAALLYDDLKLYQQKPLQESNVTFDDQTGSTGYVTYLEEVLEQLNGSEPNHQGNSAITRFIEYSLQRIAMENVTAEDNQVFITKESVSDVLDHVLEAKSDVDKVLEAFAITLNKNADVVLTFHSDNLDLSMPVIVNFDQSIVEKADLVDRILVSLDGKGYFLSISVEDLKDFGSISIQFEKSSDQYLLTFLDDSGQAVDRIGHSLSLSFPADNEFSTVFMEAGGYNLGGRYDQVSQTIQISTNLSGEYRVLQNEVSINDIDHLSLDIQNAIYFMVSRGYLTLENDRFNPADNLNRNDLTMALVKMLYAYDKNLQTTYSDVEANDEYYHYIASAQNQDIIRRLDEETFNGLSYIDKEEFLALSSQTLRNKKGYDYPEDLTNYLVFIDSNKISNDVEQEIALAVQKGLNSSGGFLMPNKEISRSEAAYVLHKLFMLMYDTPSAAINAELAATPANEAIEITQDQEKSSEAIYYILLIIIVLGGQTPTALKR